MAWSLIDEIEKHEGLMSVAVAAKLTGFSRVKIYEMIDAQEIPTVQFGSETRAKRIDPATWAFVLKRRDRMMREAVRHQG